jgi:hypothetical protein
MAPVVGWLGGACRASIVWLYYRSCGGVHLRAQKNARAVPRTTLAAVFYLFYPIRPSVTGHYLWHRHHQSLAPVRWHTRSDDRLLRNWILSTRF